MNNTFQYNRKPIIAEYRRCLFHSILELKYALMIEDTHAFLREGLEIYYDPCSLKSTLHLKSDTPKFVPDFLIRDFKTGKACLIEVKPIGFNHHELLEKRKKVYEHFIGEHNYDWEYKVVFGADIILSLQQSRKLQQILNTHHHKALYMQAIQNYDRRIQQNSSLSYFHNTPEDSISGLSPTEYRLFVRKGVLPALIP